MPTTRAGLSQRCCRWVRSSGSPPADCGPVSLSTAAEPKACYGACRGQASSANAGAAVGCAAWSESAATDEIGAAVQSNQMTTKAQREGAATMKLTTMTQVTVDGVMQGNGGATDEDRRNGFERGGWARGAGDDETRTFITQTYQRAEAFLFGRRTYELFAGSWGSIDQMRAHPIGVALNEAPKYVASTTLTAPRWEDTTVLRGDLAAAISELKAEPGGDLQVHGSGALTRRLLENDLVDEMTLIVIPVIVGQGARLFPDNGPDSALDLVESRVDSKGVTIQVFRPAGRTQYATA